MPSYRLVIEQLLASARFNVKGNLGAIHCPTLVIHGTADQVIPVSNGRALAAKIPGARLVLVDGAGHAVTIEQAGLVNREIERFLGPRAAE
jgi:pimeloyl-[acyl-carrier protein] methyl ester esterase